MNTDKFIKNLNFELILFILVYIILFVNAIVTKDSIHALISAFCGITYTILAGKGIPLCYPIGATGSAFYAYLSFASHLWGNLLLYACYYIPIQIAGFFLWNKNLKDGKYEIIKTRLKKKEKYFLFTLASVLSVFVICLLKHYGDKSPIIDGITTVFSILGMYLTVKRTFEQWTVWIIVNSLSLFMWFKIALSGQKVYSTVFMWLVYTMLAVYFCIVWYRELKQTKS